MHIKDALPDGSVVPAGKGAGELPYLLSQYKGEVLTVEPLLSVFEGFDKLFIFPILQYFFYPFYTVRYPVGAIFNSI